MRKLLSFVLFIAYSSFSLAQNASKIGEVLFIGSSVTYLPYYEKNAIDETEYFHEITINVNAATNIGNRTLIGIQLLDIFAKEPYESFENYMLYGVFSQYELVESLGLFVEASVNQGNYYFDRDKVLKRENSIFIGTGFGFNIPLTIMENLYLDLSFVFYNAIGSSNDFTQYIIGLNYKFGDYSNK